jgi:ribonuclease P protein component
VLRTGRRSAANGVAAHYLDTGSGRARLGLIAAKRLLPRALDRNRFKRIARESFRACRSSLPPFDLVLVARSGVARMTPAELRQACDRVLSTLAQN